MIIVQSILRILAIGAVLLAGIVPGAAFAQSGPPTASDSVRDCQTVRRCNFGRTGTFRGCISAYSFRTCELVTARCTIPGASSARICREFRCSWGAGA